MNWNTQIFTFTFGTQLKKEGDIQNTKWKKKSFKNEEIIKLRLEQSGFLFISNYERLKCC